MALLALWNPNIQFLKTDGSINAGGKIIVTDHNDAESIPANYSDADGTTLNASPIVLDALGRATCYIDDGSKYDLYVKDANGATLWTVSNLEPGDGSIIIRATGFEVSSADGTVDVTETVDTDDVMHYDLSIKKEIDRATKAEKGLADAIVAEKNRAEGAESTLSGSIADETKRAIAAEKASRTEIVAGANITVEKTVGADGQDVYTVSGDSEDNLVDDVRVNGASVVTDKVANIDVPVAGTASPLMDGKASVGNSLKYAREDHVHPSDTSKEDKANKTTVVLGTSDSKYPTDQAVAKFVNSSIATNTANYISNNGEPFTSVEQLEAYSGPVTNNDYAFVTGTDSEGNTYYDRYKATVSGETVTWALEYRLNNSSFTAAQWSAINSGITSALVAKIHTHSNKDVLDGITSTDVANWNSKQNSLTAGDNITIANNVISAENVLQPKDISNDPNKDFNHLPEDNVLYYKKSTTDFANQPKKGSFRFIQWTSSLYYSVQIAIDGNNQFFARSSYRNNPSDTFKTWTPWIRLQENLTFDDAPTAGSTNPVTSDGIKKAINANANVQADWNITNSSSGGFIKNKPYYTKYTTTSTYYKVCSFPITSSDSVDISGLQILARYFSGGVNGRLIYKNVFRLYYERVSDVYSNSQFVKFYYVTNGSKIDLYAQRKGYPTLHVAPLVNQPKSRVDFTDFGTDVSSLPEGATEITPVWVANSERSSGTAPVKVNEFGDLIAVPIDSIPTASSTSLMTSGGIKKALDVLQSNIDTADAKGIVINKIDGENVICFE